MTVLNKKHDGIPDDAVFIGRGSGWGNPFKIGRDGDRATVIEKYRTWLWDEIKAGRITPDDLARLHGKDLVCFCKPAACHGDVLERAAAWAANGPESLSNNGDTKHD